MRTRRSGSLVMAALVAASGCAGVDDVVTSSPTEASAALAASRVAEVRARFRFLEGKGLRRRSALKAAVGGAFRAEAGELASSHLRAEVPAAAMAGVTRAARVSFPRRASDAFVLEDLTSKMRVRFALEGARDVPASFGTGFALYAAAIEGADVVHRVLAEGTEDFVVFETQPAHERLSYAVDVSAASGLRLVDNSLELLDPSGAPRLRVAPPWVVGADGAVRAATLTVEGCAVDTSPAPPWGHAVTAPGASACRVHVSWAGVMYPALVDPAWTTTGSMATARHFHTATRLSSGRVLVAGGTKDDYGFTAAAEIYDPASGTFAATGSMATMRCRSTATLLGNGKVLVAAGNGPDGAWDPAPIAGAELFDETTGVFTVTGPLQKVRMDHTATLLPSGKVVVIGGSGPPATAAAELYDPTTGTFSATPGAPLLPYRSRHTATTLGSGKVLVAGGDAGYASGQPNELYDPTAGTFAPTGAMTTPRSWHTASLLPSGKVLVAGGFPDSFAPMATAELFDPAANGGAGAFVEAGAMSVSRFGATATRLPSGSVLVVGGKTQLTNPASTAPTAAADVFDPAQASFLAVTGSSFSRALHAATLLENDAVLVTGGISLNEDVTKSAELYAGPPVNAGDAGGGSGSSSGGAGDDDAGTPPSCGSGGASSSSSSSSSGGAMSGGDPGGGTAPDASCGMARAGAPRGASLLGAALGVAALLVGRRRLRRG